MNRASARRVARRHTAGLLKNPPVMFKEVSKWVLTNMARWILHASPEDLASSRRDEQKNIELRDMASARLRKLAGSGRPEMKTTFMVDLKGWPYLRSFGKATKRAMAQIEKELEKAAESQQSVNEQVEVILPLKNHPVIKKFLKGFDHSDSAMGLLQDAISVVREASGLSVYDARLALLLYKEGSYGQADVPVPLFLRRLFRIRPQTKLSIKEIRRLMAQVDSMPEHEVAEAALAVLPNGFVSIDVVLNPQEETTGAWYGHNKTIKVSPYLPWVGMLTLRGEPKLDEMLRRVEQTVRHELQHMTQDLIKALAGLEDEGGIPSLRVRDTNWTPGGFLTRTPVRTLLKDFVRKDYILRDVEFYPWVEDAAREFNAWAKEERLSKRDWDKERKSFVGQRVSGYSSRYGTNDLFWNLLQSEPDKWKKAVGEFWKATERPPDFTFR